MVVEEGLVHRWCYFNCCFDGQPTFFGAGDAFQSGDYVNMLTMLGCNGNYILLQSPTCTFKLCKFRLKNDTSLTWKEFSWKRVGDGIWEEFKEFQCPFWVWAKFIFYLGTIPILGLFYGIFLCRVYPKQIPVSPPKFGSNINEEVKESNAKFAETWKNPDHNTLVAMGESVFLVQCAPCHGVDAEGIEGKAQDLTHRISKKQVLYTIEHGQDSLGYPM